jgi:P27 family predicted phage terminase small subunit
MGRRGPVGKLRVIAGTVKPKGPAFVSGRPNCPAWLSVDAQAEWHRVLPEIEAAGMLTVVDQAALAAYCQAWAELKLTTQIVDTEGRTIQEPIQSAKGEIVGHKLKAHPAVRLQRDAFARVKSFLQEFGFSPASRARVGASGVTGAIATHKASNRLEEIRSRVQSARQPKAS